MFRRLRTRPQDPEEYVLLGQLYEAQRFPKHALELYRRGVELGPGCFKAHYQLGLRLADDGQSKEADTAFARAAEIDPDYAPVWIRRARRAAERNDPQAALAFVERYVALRSKDPVGLVERAKVQVSLERWEAAKADLDRAGKLGPVGRVGHRLYSTVYRNLDRPDDGRFHALMSAEVPLDAPMDDPIALMVRRLATFKEPQLTRFASLVDAGRYKDAIAVAEAEEFFVRRKDDGGFGIICGKIAECYRQLGDLTFALVYGEQSRRAMPDAAAPHASMALTYLSGGHFPQTLTAVNRALAIDPDTHVALYARGLARIQFAVRDMAARAGRTEAGPRARLEGAVADLERCVRQKPVNHGYLVALATAYGMQGNHERADVLLTTALRIRPDDPKTIALKRRAERGQDFWPESPTKR